MPQFPWPKGTAYPITAGNAGALITANILPLLSLSNILLSNCCVRPGVSAQVGDPALINDVIAAVDVKCFASDQPSGIVSEERGGNAHVVDADEAPCRRFRLRLVQ